MPLDPAVAVTEVRKITDPTHPSHSWPASTAAVKARWASAVATYFGGLVSPTLVPGTVELAEAAMVAAFNPGAGTAGLDAGLAAFAGIIVAGIGPGLVASPPPAPPAWGDLTPTSNGAARGSQIGQAIDAWARSGLYGPTGGPPALPWA